MNWVLVGYVAKRRAERAGWVSPWNEYPDVEFPVGPPVEEICSVSRCIARRVDTWQDTRYSDPLDLFPDVEQAWAEVPVDQRAAFAVYGYRLWPMQFEHGGQSAIDLWWEPKVVPLTKSFERLGWDAVVGGNNQSFGCSPLSCNSGSEAVRCPELNRHCLVSDEQAAFELARRFSILQPEPGPYCVVEVWREMTVN